MRMAGQEFLVGEFLTLEDDTLGFRVPRKTKEGIPKAKKDPRIYPEDWRKPEVWKGDHFDTWDPFQVWSAAVGRSYIILLLLLSSLGMAV